MVTLRDLIEDGRVHVLDGAMGTMLYGKGVFVNQCYDDLNLKQPGLIRDVHEAYLSAGAEIVETNTFGANPVKLVEFGLAEQTEAINEAAARIAVEAANRALRSHQPRRGSGFFPSAGNRVTGGRRRRVSSRNIQRSR